MKKILFTLFIVVTLGELTSQIINIPLLHSICKPLILVSLIGYYLTGNTARSIKLLIAMILSFAGDVLLMSAALFIPGLIAFLIAHIFYLLAYREHQTNTATDELSNMQRIRMAFPIVLAGSGLVVILFPVLGDLKIPVMIYALVLTLMVLNALFRYKKTSKQSFSLVFGGAVLFMISDSLLAIDKFLQPLPLGGFWIMLTYCAAQFLIIEGLLLHKKFVQPG